jgi:hypothetical protein
MWPCSVFRALSQPVFSQRFLPADAFSRLEIAVEIKLLEKALAGGLC